MFGASQFRWTITRFANNRQSNLAPAILASIYKNLGAKTIRENILFQEFTPEDIFQYVYTLLYSPGYRARYAEFLKIDFPRLPLTSSLDLFRSLAKLGSKLVALHLMESPQLDKHITKWVGGKNPEVEKVTYSDETVWIDKAQNEGFDGVPEEVWNFHIGGYQVCEKWLKDRKGRTLSKDDIAHYQKIIVALAETIRLMGEIDEVIEEHGGWPGAFAADRQESQ
jgi:predicted helicase